ncbi:MULTISPECIES: DUF262 domain-containing protein [unclassified Moorena]|uniref:GmrSD restriction endonuclease domain-containing protein n=1 Tax=unclassified Moorena TaxID=2683338 RepID=UPI0013C56296|nr:MULTISPECIES: DUF262 domain-containing protein [unclassified Moorena]NEO19882.1 DUF262 domain-containing protein [Moorena sp. SIO4A5]NEQ57051.1 DUF262 domain-containing protein [Moorena sp. SIO4A1]
MSNSPINIPASSVQRELSIRSESIQRVYNFYINKIFYVNRRYQRKLVWTIEEKRAFIDSILKGFPVPIILLAETEREQSAVFEIIDGMQRLNAITSFIEGEFDIDDKYFDLATMVESKSRLDKGLLNQKEPILERSFCEIIASYILPISVYSFDDEEKVDEIFRRINSNGRYLSRQELRAAGATAYFPDLVRTLSSEIRSDTSASDILLLNDMKYISITNKNLDYGIKVDDIFWVRNNIINKEMVRESKDEEIVADLIAYIALFKDKDKDVSKSSSEVLDQYYGLKPSYRKDDIETTIQKKNPERIKEQFLKVYDQIRKILDECGLKFNELILDPSPQTSPRYFQTIFLSLYELMFIDKMEVADYAKLAKKLKNIGKHIDITRGGTWSAINKTHNIRAVQGIIRDAFRKREKIDPATDNWLIEFETLLTQSKTEQTLYDFKQGFTKLDGKGEFDHDNFKKIIKTLTAMANSLPKATGYVCVGVADTDRDARRIEELYGIESRNYKNFKITGIGHEAERLKDNLDNFFKWLVQKVKSQPIEESLQNNIGRNIKLVRYYEKDVIIFSLSASRDPVIYGDKYYQRIGSNVEEVMPTEFPDLFRRFHKA